MIVLIQCFPCGFVSLSSCIIFSSCLISGSCFIPACSLLSTWPEVLIRCVFCYWFDLIICNAVFVWFSVFQIVQCDLLIRFLWSESLWPGVWNLLEYVLINCLFWIWSASSVLIRSCRSGFIGVELCEQTYVFWVFSLFWLSALLWVFDWLSLSIWSLVYVNWIVFLSSCLFQQLCLLWLFCWLAFTWFVSSCLEFWLKWSEFWSDVLDWFGRSDSFDPLLRSDIFGQIVVNLIILI